jgi:hypothetical protein
MNGSESNALVKRSVKELDKIGVVGAPIIAERLGNTLA